MSVLSITTSHIDDNSYSITKTISGENSSIYSTSTTKMELENQLNISDYNSIRTTQLLYFYGTLPLMFFCLISIAVNIKILVSVYWIRRPLSPTLHISLSLTGADAFSSTALGVGLVMNSFIPQGLRLDLPDAECFLLSLEAIRLGAVITTTGHLVALAINHYLGILRPLHYVSIMTHRVTTVLTIILWITPPSFFLAYFHSIENEGFQSPGCNRNLFLLKEKFRVMFSSLFFGPFILMVCIYTHIFCLVRKHQASRLRFTRTGSSFHRSNSNDRHQRVHQQMARSVKAVHTTLLIIGSFMVGWMPAIFLYIMVCDDCPLKFSSIDEGPKFIIYNAANCLIILKTLVNPIIYAARMHEIQVATRRMHVTIRALLGLKKSIGERNNIGLQNSHGALSRRTSQSNSIVVQLANDFSKKRRQNRNFRYTYADFKSIRRNVTDV